MKTGKLLRITHLIVSISLILIIILAFDRTKLSNIEELTLFIHIIIGILLIIFIAEFV